MDKLHRRRLMLTKANKHHIGICMGTYAYVDCIDCPCEKECIDLFLKEMEENK